MITHEFTDSDGMNHTFHCMACSCVDCQDCVDSITNQYTTAGKTVHEAIPHDYDEVQECGSSHALEIVWTQ
jgi:hypothetical protein